jgi:hypothetical protein
MMQNQLKQPALNFMYVLMMIRDWRNSEKHKFPFHEKNENKITRISNDISCELIEKMRNTLAE